MSASSGSGPSAPWHCPAGHSPPGLPRRPMPRMPPRPAATNFDARAIGEEALTLARQLGDDLAIAKAAFALGIVRLHAGNVAGARDLLREALDLFRRLGA